jgi:hypothetical protein
MSDDQTHFHVLNAIQTINLMHQLGPNNTFNQRKAQIEHELYVPDLGAESMTAIANMRNLYDTRGKVMLCIAAKAMGVRDQELVVDPAQAGGLLGTSDGAIVREDNSLSPIEIKCTRTKKGKRNTFFVKDIRLVNTDWRHLFIVGFGENLDIWTDASEYRRRRVWIAHVTRRDLFRAATARGLGIRGSLDATITPGSRRGWLGPCVKWIRARDFSRRWWDATVLRK